MDIISAAYLISNADYKACPKPDRPEYAFIGRSNVGKSSLINMLCNNTKLAKTSAAPGKTQLINHFTIQSNSGKKTAEQWYLVDLPGYGFAKVSQTSRRRWEQMIENYLRKRENLVNVFVLIDSRHGPQKIDLAFISQLDKWKVPFALVFTKTDKEKPAVVERNIKAFFETLSETWQFLPRHFITSSEKKQGREALLDFIAEQNQLVA
ncbi:MAG: ribosome biogenesis GTP-binding protein YihA/YsxC [Sediminibacterium sp.]|jgi:GTP-binding protein|nr:YihA family ribosome biogenesis GTP-binding protein [Chitinophagaceae bacterium]MCA6447995.1 YihA family ribosome biogenesis GTP-binding protein [Chitinophagaceae bacterium]